MHTLDRRFIPLGAFEERANSEYSLLPSHFLRLDSGRYIVTNFSGEYCILNRTELRQYVLGNLPSTARAYRELKSKQFLIDGNSSIALDLLAAKYRTKKRSLSEFTSLHIIVPTLRCNHQCQYCQVSRQSEERTAFDMNEETADAAVEFMFRSPSRALKLEFQGGEPLLAFDLVRHTILAAEQRSREDGRPVEFVICTNLAAITDEILAFCLEHDVFISTSLDGPRDLHNANRRTATQDSHQRTVQGIWRAREVLGPDRVSALMTTTSASLDHPREIIDECLRQGFHSIFLRSINPYGHAARMGTTSLYKIEEWLAFYREALEYILDLNKKGIFFREDYAAIILRKILTPFDTGFVDLRSPAGAGIAVILFNYDGGIYVSDEARMLAEMGDQRFRLGSLLVDSYEQVMLSDGLLSLVAETMAETVPMCADCGIQPYCGSDPVRHYRSQGDIVGFKPTSEFCQKNTGVIRHLIHLLEDVPEAAAIMRSWALP